MFGLGHWELLLILLVILLVFGAKRIPEMAQGMGRGIREFRKAVHEVQDEVEATKPAAGNTLNPTAATDQVPRQPAPEQQTPAQQTAEPAPPAADDGAAAKESPKA